MIGRVTNNIVVEKGYFFIRVVVDQTATDYFAHRSALRGLRIDEVHEGELLQFMPVGSERGPRAEEVRRAPDDAEEGPERVDEIRTVWDTPVSSQTGPAK